MTTNLLTLSPNEGKVYALPSSGQTDLIDSFGRLRVSNPTTIVQLRHDSPVSLAQQAKGEVSGSGTSSTINDGTTDIEVGTSVGLYRLRSEIRGSYINGQSQTLFFTFNFTSNGQANVVKRIGYFDDSDGVFLSQTGEGEYAFTLRSSVIPSVTVFRSNWDNPLDNPSDENYVDLDDKAHIFFISYAYVGVGQVKCGFSVNGKLVVAHTFNKTNTNDNVYWRTPNLFLSYEIQRTVSGGTSDMLRVGLSTALREGQAADSAQANPLIVTSSAVKPMAQANTNYLLGLFRLNPSASTLASNLRLREVGVSMRNNADIVVFVVKNPPLGGYTPSWSDYTSSSLQYDWVSSTVSVANTFENSLDVVVSGLGVSAIDISGATVLNGEPLGTNFDDTPIFYGLIGISFTSNENIEYRKILCIEEY